jgi:Fe-S-cluster containining protein
MILPMANSNGNQEDSRAEINYHCTKCGECCKSFSDEKGVILFPVDVIEISRHLKLTTGQFKSSFCNPRPVTMETSLPTLYVLKHINGDCIFLSNSGLCTIYSSRPIQCQRGPFNFFWTGSLDYTYECWESADVPSDWSSHDLDQSLINEFYTNS